MLFLVLFSLIHLSATASRQAQDCPPDYTSDYIQKANGNTVSYCYKVFVTYYTRQQAVARCAQDGATLATISSTDENMMYVRADRVTGSLAIGLSCIDDHTCVFDDGTPFNNSSFNAFAGGHPQTSSGECVALQTLGTTAGRWISVPCTTIGSFVCQYTPNSLLSRQTGCNSFYTEDQIDWPVKITSPHYPENYGNGDSMVTCTYFFYNGWQKGVNITFSDFDTYQNTDVVEIFSSKSFFNMTMVGQYSGRLGQFSVIAPGAATFIRFAGVQPVSRGFSAIVNTL